MGLAESFEKLALQSGFAVAGAVDIDLALNELNENANRFEQWIQGGLHGEMAYLARGQERRRDPRLLLPKAESVLSVGYRYNALPLGAQDSSNGVRYARYLRGPDYHVLMKEQLEAIMRQISEPGLSYKVCVDTSALLERAWAAITGLGWIGKNNMLIHPQHGSYLLLGFVLTSRKTGRTPKLLRDLCGSCTRCLNACPTKALSPSKILNSNRCISYWTLEKRGALELNESDQTAMKNWVAGCDLCQEACPFNTKALNGDIHAGPAAEESLPYQYGELAGETQDHYLQRVKNSALNRVKYENFQRNLGIALKNSAKPQAT